MDESNFSLYNRIGLFAGLAGFILVLVSPAPEGISPEGWRTAAVAVLMATWWITEAVPLAATALLPIALFPLFGIMPAKAVTASYGDPNIYLFAGGFFIAMAMQKWGLHERIALNIVKRTGTNMNRLVLGFMISTAGISLWISNTATALMMMPIAMAIVTVLEEQRGKEATANFSICLLLGIAYASSIGGMGTPIGTPPNIVFLSKYQAQYPEGPPIAFLQWMMFGVPLVLVMLPLTWLILTKILFRFDSVESKAAADEIDRRLAALGPINRGEMVVLGVFVMSALGWIFRADLEFDAFKIPGWSNLFPNPDAIRDDTVAILAATVLFITPVDLRKGEFVLDWNWAKRIPWDILILFGGGLALANGLETVKLVDWIGGKFALLEGVSPFVIVLTICAGITLVGELASNVAMITIMIPILVGAAPVLNIHPLLLMVPATLAASCGFMLPVATPPNAIVFGTGKIPIPRMVRAGIAIDILGILLVTFLGYYVVTAVLGIDVGAFPAWAVKPAP